MDVGSEVGVVTGEVAGVGVCDGVRAGIVVADWSLCKLGCSRWYVQDLGFASWGGQKKLGWGCAGRGAANFLGFHSLLETASPSLQW
jgi:hypothetical protein